MTARRAGTLAVGVGGGGRPARRPPGDVGVLDRAGRCAARGRAAARRRRPRRADADRQPVILGRRRLRRSPDERSEAAPGSRMLASRPQRGRGRAWSPCCCCAWRASAYAAGGCGGVRRRRVAALRRRRLRPDRAAGPASRARCSPTRAEQRQALLEGSPAQRAWSPAGTASRRQAAAAGLERRAWETSSEYTLRVLDLVDADAAGGVPARRALPRGPLLRARADRGRPARRRSRPSTPSTARSAVARREARRWTSARGRRRWSAFAVLDGRADG